MPRIIMELTSRQSACKLNHSTADVFRHQHTSCTVSFDLVSLTHKCECRPLQMAVVNTVSSLPCTCRSDGGMTQTHLFSQVLLCEARAVKSGVPSLVLEVGNVVKGHRLLRWVSEQCSAAWSTAHPSTPVSVQCCSTVDFQSFSVMY